MLQIIKVIFLRKVLKSWDEFEDERFDRMENREQNTLVPHCLSTSSLFIVLRFSLFFSSPPPFSRTLYTYCTILYIYITLHLSAVAKRQIEFHCSRRGLRKTERRWSWARSNSRFPRRELRSKLLRTKLHQWNRLPGQTPTNANFHTSNGYATNPLYTRSNRASRTWPQIPEIKIVPGTWDDDSNTVRSSNEHGTWDNYSSFEIVMIFLFLMIWYQVSLGPTRFSRRCSSSFENSRIFSSNSGRTKVHFTFGLVRFLESERYQKFQSDVKNIILRPSYILLLINICIYIILRNLDW